MINHRASASRRAFVAAGAAFFLSSLPVRAQEPAEPLTIFAAASLREALDAVNVAWAATGKPAARISYAGSGALARQIEQGAPADLFISASDDWMDLLSARRAIRAETRREILTNRLVIIANRHSARLLTPEPGMRAELLHIGGKLVIGDEKSVPAGTYAKAALERLGIWTDLQPHLVRVGNVRMALALVARGEADTGVVYASDALAEPRVKVIGTIPPALHPPIRYPAAVTGRGFERGATGFLDFLTGPAARTIFARFGFAPIG
jgi:molybdate transport system substrate-binding protein